MVVEAVLDANVLFRMLISQGDILEILFNDKLRLCAPERLKEEFLKREDEITEKSKLPLHDLEKLTSLPRAIGVGISTKQLGEKLSSSLGLAKGK